MIISDDLYGKFEINEPVILDIINSKDFQRLKGISLAGFYPAYPNLSEINNSRYYHSIGVFLLLRKFNTTIEEQITGLIHDVSHTAFSHTIDYIMGSLKDQKVQNTQDNSHENFIKNSEINNILKKYNFNVDYILNDENFTLKENNIPNICADRIDYSLRQAYVCYNKISKEQKDFIINSLVNYNGSFIMRNSESAKLFANVFWDMDEENWSGMKSAIMFAVSAKMFKIAIEEKFLVLEDFYQNDDLTVIKKLEKYLYKNEFIKKYYDYLQFPKEYFGNDKNNFIDHVFCKVRKIDPQFLTENNKLLRVSDIDKDFSVKIKSCPKSKEYFIQKTK